MALAIDASSPPLVTANATTVTTASFTPPVGALLVAFALGTSFSGTPNAVLTSTGLTFTSQLLNNGAGEGTVQVFTSLVGAAGGSARTVNLSVSGYASCGLKVYVVTGQHATLYVDNTASGTSTANVINAAIATTNDGCMVLGGASEFIGLGVPTTTDAGEGLDDATGGVSYLAPRRAGETVKAGPELVNMDAFGTTAASWYWILISIRPAAYTAPAVGKTADRGQATNTTTATSTAVAMSAAGSISTGNYLIARIALDNAGTSGAAPTCTITDPRSNTWTVVGPANRTAASAANDGSTTYIAYAKVVNAYTNGDSLTVNHSPTTPAKAINVEEWYGIDGATPVAVASTTATGSSATPSIARTPTAAGQLFYGAISAEGPATDVFTQDTDTTDGAWVTLTRVASANATAASNQDVYGVAKLVAGTSAQTWNPNIGTSRDWAQLALVFAPAAGGGVTGSASAVQRSTSASSAVKNGTGTSPATGRAATGSSGRKITSGGTADTQRSAAATTARKTGAGGGIDQQRAATSSAAAKATVGVALDQTRSTTLGTGLKAAAGAGLDQQRAATQSTGTAATGASGAALSAQRTSTAATGRKLATSTSTGQQRTATLEAGLKAAAAAGLDQQRTATRVTSLKTGAGAALDQTRSATISTGGPVTGIGGAGRVASRSSVGSTGRKTTTGAGAATGRAGTTGTGVHRGGGAGVAASRTQSQTSGRRAGIGAVRVTQRCTLSSSGSKVAAYTPLSDPVSTIRVNLATATPRSNAASATARTNQAKAAL